MVFVGDLQAGEFDVADAQIEPFSDSAQLLSSVLHAMMISQPRGNAFLQARIIAITAVKSKAENGLLFGFPNSREI